MFLCYSHFYIYICISLLFIFSIIRTLDYPDSRLSGLSIIRTLDYPDSRLSGLSIIRTLDYPDSRLSGLFTEVPMSPDNRDLTVVKTWSPITQNPNPGIRIFRAWNSESRRWMVKFQYRNPELWWLLLRSAKHSIELLPSFHRLLLETLQHWTAWDDLIFLEPFTTDFRWLGHM